jgi:cell division protein FtsL
MSSLYTILAEVRWAIPEPNIKNEQNSVRWYYLVKQTSQITQKSRINRLCFVQLNMKPAQSEA